MLVVLTPWFYTRLFMFYQYFYMCYIHAFVSFFFHSRYSGSLYRINNRSEVCCLFVLCFCKTPHYSYNNSNSSSFQTWHIDASKQQQEYLSPNLDDHINWHSRISTHTTWTWPKIESHQIQSNSNLRHKKIHILIYR